MAQRKRYCFRATGPVGDFLQAAGAGSNTSEVINDAIQFYLDVLTMDPAGASRIRVQAATWDVRLGQAVGRLALAGLKGAKR